MFKSANLKSQRRNKKIFFKFSNVQNKQAKSNNSKHGNNKQKCLNDKTPKKDPYQWYTLSPIHYYTKSNSLHIDTYRVNVTLVILKKLF